MEAGPEPCFLSPAFFYDLLLFDVLMCRPKHTHLLTLVASFLAGEIHSELCCTQKMGDNRVRGEREAGVYLCLVIVPFPPLLILSPLHN